MKKYLLIIPVVFAFVMSGCFTGPCVNGYGPVVSETHDIEDFTAVSNTTSFEVRVTESDTFSVVVEAQESLHRIIEIYESGGVLTVKTKNGICFTDHVPTVIYVTLPYLEEIRNTGSGRLSADRADCSDFEMVNTGSGMIRIDTVVASTTVLKNTGSGSVELLDAWTDDLHVRQSGSGEIEAGYFYMSQEVVIDLTSSGRINATLLNGLDVDVKLTGSGRVELRGNAEYALYELTSSGKIDGIDLEIFDAVARITGSGKIYINASETLDAHITGSGDVYYLGNPLLSVSGGGSGQVRPY